LNSLAVHLAAYIKLFADVDVARHHCKQAVLLHGTWCLYFEHSLEASE